MSRPDEIDDGIPGQPEEPAPEGHAPRFVARQRLQDLDEDELRQVLRVRRALDAAGDEAIDRLVVMIEDHPECPLVTRTGFGHEPLDRGVVDRHNDGTRASLGVSRRAVPVRQGHGDPVAAPAEREIPESRGGRNTIPLLQAR